MGAGPPTWLVLVNPMLDELAASLVVNRPAVTSATRFLHAVASVPQEVQDSLMVRDGPTSVVACVGHAFTDGTARCHGCYGAWRG
jgi:hypothetical protein